MASSQNPVLGAVSSPNIYELLSNIFFQQRKCQARTTPVLRMKRKKISWQLVLGKEVNHPVPLSQDPSEHLRSKKATQLLALLNCTSPRDQFGEQLPGKWGSLPFPLKGCLITQEEFPLSAKKSLSSRGKKKKSSNTQQTLCKEVDWWGHCYKATWTGIDEARKTWQNLHFQEQ